MKINSLNNPRIKEWTKLKKKKYRDMTQSYLVEGEHLVEEAIKAGVVKTIISVSHYHVPDIECIEVSEDIIEKLSFVETPQPVLAICKMNQQQTIVENGQRYLLLDDLQDPGNIGTLIRTAVAFGYDQVILNQNSVDLYNEKLIRASQGACFYVNCIRLDLALAIDQLNKHGVAVYGTSLDNGVDIQSIKDKDGSIAILLGNEGNGVNSSLLGKTKRNIYIPIRTAESLNVAIAGGICMFYFQK